MSGYLNHIRQVLLMEKTSIHWQLVMFAKVLGPATQSAIAQNGIKVVTWCPWTAFLTKTGFQPWREQDQTLWMQAMKATSSQGICPAFMWESAVRCQPHAFGLPWR